MRQYPFDAARMSPVTHDPELSKHVLMDERVSCIRRISRISLGPGNTATLHSHPDDNEVFYCIKGGLTVNVNDEPVILKEGGVLVIEPGEAHAITELASPTELLYMRVSGR